MFTGKSRKDKQTQDFGWPFIAYPPNPTCGKTVKFYFISRT